MITSALKYSGAVLIEGPKWCGKTWTGMRHAQSAIWVSDPTGNYLTRRIAASDPFSLLTGEQPVLIDEWQDAPGLWDAVRMAIDRQPGPGQYVLTGSSTPRDTVISHSGTGRITRISMWPMTLTEAGMTDGRISLANLLEGENPATLAGQWLISNIAEAIVRGGWPGTINLPLPEAVKIPGDYLRSVAYADASIIDGVRRDPDRLTALLAALARSTSTQVRDTTLARDMSSLDSPSTATKTVTTYLDVLRRLHVLKEIPAWTPALRSPVRLRNSPKRILCDPSLAAAGMHATTDTVQADPKTLGLLFENLCLRDLSVYAQATGAEVFHYRDQTDLEVDAIVQCADGRWAGIEIKLNASQEDTGARSLLTLASKMTRAGEQPPVALIVLTGTGGFAHRREDNVIAIPIDCLGP
jgi:predicted AAA+ superfamily ATPase